MAIGTTTKAMQWLPSAAAGASCTAGGSAWTWGSGTSLGTLPANDCALMAFHVGDIDGSAARAGQIQFSPTSDFSGRKWTFPIGRHGTLTTSYGPRHIHVPLEVSASSQIYARVACDTASVVFSEIKVGFIELPDVWTKDVGVSCYPDLGTVSLTPSGTADQFGSWTEVIASASSDIQLWGLGGIQGVGSVYYAIQVGIGTTPKLTLGGRAADSHFDVSPPPEPVLSIPSGSQVQARIAVSSTSTAAWSVGFAFFQDALAVAGGGARSFGVVIM